MFDIWHKIMEEGEAAILASPSELSALEWCEVGEKYPHLVPEPFRGYEPLNSPFLIRESPFVNEKGDEYLFAAQNAGGITTVERFVSAFNEVTGSRWDEYIVGQFASIADYPAATVFPTDRKPGGRAAEHLRNLDAPYRVRLLVRNDHKLRGTIADAEIAGLRTLIHYFPGHAVKKIRVSGAETARIALLSAPPAVQPLG